MRLITWKRLEQWGALHADARPWLAAWAATVQKADWEHLADVRESYPHADEVIVKSGPPVTVFNVKGNRYRMITAIHYNTHSIYAMRFMTHAEYDKDLWKEVL
jgi:mRNA interferase HigB